MEEAAADGKIAEILCRTPAISEAVIGRVATVRHSQNETAATEDGVAHVTLRQRGHALWRRKSIAVTVLGLPP